MKKKKLLLIVTIILAIFLAIGSFIFINSSKITDENYEKIQVGMSKGDVNRIMGFKTTYKKIYEGKKEGTISIPSADDPDQPGEYEIKHYGDYDAGSITDYFIYFQNGKVVYKKRMYAMS